MFICKCGRSFKFKNNLSYHKNFCGKKKLNNCLWCNSKTKNLKFCNMECKIKFYTNNNDFKEKIKESMKNVTKTYTSHSHTKDSIEKIRNSLLLHYKHKRELLLKTTSFNNLPKELAKKIFIEEKKNKCDLCGFEYTDSITGKGPFEIHHKDGNRNNWNRNNLEYICLNCHWKTDTYRFRNRSHTEETKKKISKNNYQTRKRAGNSVVE